MLEQDNYLAKESIMLEKDQNKNNHSTNMNFYYTNQIHIFIYTDLHRGLEYPIPLINQKFISTTFVFTKWLYKSLVKILNV